MKNRFRFVIFLSHALFFFSEASAQQAKDREADSLEQILPHLKGQDRIEGLLWLGKYYWFSDSHRATRLLQTGIGLATAEKREALLSQLYSSLAVSYNIRSSYDSAELNYEKALKWAEHQQDKVQIATIYSNMAILYNYKQQYARALELLHKSIEIRDLLNDSKGKMNAYGTIASVLNNIGDLRNAMHYDSLAYQIAIETGNEESAYAILNNLATKLNMIGKANDARKAFLKVIRYKETNHPLSHRLANAYHSYGEVLFNHFNDPDSSRFYALEALAIQTTLKNVRETADAHELLSRIDLQGGKSDEAEQHARTAYHVYDSLKLKMTVMNQFIVYDLVRIYSLQKRFAEAARFDEEFWAVTDSLGKGNVFKATVEMQTRYETLQKVKENELLKKETDLKEALIQKKNYTLFSSAFGIVLLIGIAILLHYRNKQKSQINELLQLENQSLRVENLNAQLHQLKNQINPHFLFNALSTLKAMAKEGDRNTEKYIQSLSDVYRYILQIDAADLISLKQELAIAQAYLFMLKNQHEDNLKACFELPEHLLEKRLPPFSLQLLIENAVKHNIISRAKPFEITLTAFENNWLQIRNPMQLKRSVAESTKVGLKNLESRFRLLGNYTIKIENDGQFFSVKIPLI